MNTLDKEEFRIKLEEINKLVQDKDYKGAMSIVDSIDWRRVKNVRTLCVVGEIYAANGRYEDSKEIFLLAYHKASVGKNILYRLIEISLRMDDISEAEDFFEEYRQVASNDNTQYILQYKIAKAKNASLNEQIRILEEYFFQLKELHISDVAEGIEQIGERFGNVCRLRNEKLEETKKMLEQAFSFLEECFGEGQELLLFETGLTGDDRCSIFISQYGCPSYFKHCELLLYSKKENELRKECRDLLEE